MSTTGKPATRGTVGSSCHGHAPGQGAAARCGRLFVDHHQAGAFKMAFSPYLDRAAMRSRDKIVAQMADDLRTFAANLGSVTEADLELMGLDGRRNLRPARAATRRCLPRCSRCTIL